MVFAIFQVKTDSLKAPKYTTGRRKLSPDEKSRVQETIVSQEK